MEALFKRFESMKVLSGSTLKLIALFTMMCDHVGSILLSRSELGMTPFLSIGSHGLTLYAVSRMIGRIAFPIYCFLITEGFIHTHDRKRYGISLLIFALISEIPWNLEHSGHLTHPTQNVFFTLFLGYLGICAVEKYKEDTQRLLLSLLALFGASFLLKCDYGCRGFALIVLIYVLRDRKVLQAILGSCMVSSAYAAIIAFIPINLYNGERGFIKGKALKYAFYVAYPLHIFILYLIRLNTFGYN